MNNTVLVVLFLFVFSTLTIPGALATTQTVCTGSLVVTDINETPQNNNDGQFARVDLRNVSPIIPATSAICLNPFAYYWQGGERLEMLDSSFISQDSNSNFVAFGSITVRDNSGIQLGVGAGWYQGSGIRSRYGDREQMTVVDVTIDANSRVQLDITAIFNPNGNVKLNDNVVVRLLTSSKLMIQRGGNLVLDAHTVLTVGNHSALDIGQASKLQTAYLSGPVNITLGQFSKLAIADYTNCIVTAREVTVPDFTLEIWGANFSATGITCVGLVGLRRSPIGSVLKEK